MQPNSQSWRSLKKAEVAERRARVAQMYLVEKRTMKQIAQELGVSEFTISEDMAALKAGWRAQAKFAVEEHIAVELMRIERNEQIAREAYLKSCKPKRVVNASKRTGMAGEVDVQSATQMEREEGDPRWIALLAKFTDQRMRLLGLNGQPDEDDNDKRRFTTFEDFVAAHVRQKKLQSAEPAKALPAHG